MTTEHYNLATVILWALSLIAGIGTVIIYSRQLRVMTNSLTEQNTAWLIQYLQSPDVRTARTLIFSEIDNTNCTNANIWTEKQKDAAGTACSAYGIAGILVEKRRVNSDTIIDNWGPSILKTCRICRTYIEQRRSESGSEYWSKLLWLEAEAKKRHPNL